MERLQSPPMRFFTSINRKTVHRLAAIMIVLWWGGLNCLAGCIAAPVDVAAPSHCSMSAEGDCCLSEASGNKDEPPGAYIGSPSTSLQPLACCSLEAYSADERRDVRAKDGAAVTPAPSRLSYAPTHEAPVQLPDRWVRLPDRGGTYLICCVFLI